MNNSDDFKKAIDSLDLRLSKIEKILELDIDEQEKDLAPLQPAKVEQRSELLELQVGKYWLAKIGILIFTVGLLFLISSSFENSPIYFPSLLGYLITAIFFATHFFGKKWLLFIDDYVLSTGFILLFFSTLRLAYFGNDVVINNNYVEIGFLLIVSIAFLLYSLKKNSIYLTTLSLLFSFITIILLSNSLLALFCLLAISAIVVWVAKKFDWNNIMFWGIVLSYISYLVILTRNPIIYKINEVGHFSVMNLLLLFGLFIIFSIGLMIAEKEENEKKIKVTSIFLNSFLAAIVFLIITYTKNIENLSIYSFLVFLSYLLFAVLSWITNKSKYATFFYSILGYLLLSISIISGFQKPEFFIVLTWQSLLVVSTAIWFRSRIIIVANFMIYLFILFAFLLLASNVTYISISFGIVALMSARLLNWKKKELELNSEGMRNAYLICAFLIFPYSLYKSVPDGFVTISWIGVAILYYLLSIVLKNTKYRWLAISTLLLSVVYAIFFGITELSSELRILTFIILGVVLLTISLLYSKKNKIPEDSLTNENNK